MDLFAEADAAAEDEKDDEDEDEEGDDDGEPEDDFNAAWEILEFARKLYEKRKGEDDAIKLKLAETYVALGDISLETGESEDVYHLDAELATFPNIAEITREIRRCVTGLRGGSGAQIRTPSYILPPDCRSAFEAQHDP